MKFFTSVAKWLKLKARKFWGLNPTFVEVTGQKLVGGLFAPPPRAPHPECNHEEHVHMQPFYKDFVKLLKRFYDKAFIKLL